MDYIFYTPFYNLYNVILYMKKILKFKNKQLKIKTDVDNISTSTIKQKSNTDYDNISTSIIKQKSNTYNDNISTSLIKQKSNTDNDNISSSTIKPKIDICTICNHIVVTNMNHNEIPTTIFFYDDIHGNDYHSKYSHKNSNSSSPSSSYTSSIPCTPYTPYTPYTSYTSCNLNRNNIKKSNIVFYNTNNTNFIIKNKKQNIIDISTEPKFNDCNLCNGMVVTNIKHINIPMYFSCDDLHGYDYHTDFKM